MQVFPMQGAGLILAWRIDCTLRPAGALTHLATPQLPDFNDFFLMPVKKRSRYQRIGIFVLPGINDNGRPFSANIKGIGER